MSQALNEYYEALHRLIKNKPLIVKKGSKINNDTVALEAGRGRGSIKANREEHQELIFKIEQASKKSATTNKKIHLKFEKLKEEKESYRKKYEDSLGRELMLIDELSYKQKEIEALKVKLKMLPNKL